MKDDDDWKSIDELCRPLSAKVMPKRMKLSLTGETRGEGRLLNMQRHMRDGGRTASRVRARSKGKGNAAD